jgi:hypothetical protein
VYIKYIAENIDCNKQKVGITFFFFKVKKDTQMNPETRAYKIPIHHHSLILTQNKYKQSHQPIGKIKSNKIYGSPTKIYFLVLSTTLFKGSNSAKKSKDFIYVV